MGIDIVEIKPQCKKEPDLPGQALFRLVFAEGRQQLKQLGYSPTQQSAALEGMQLVDRLVVSNDEETAEKNNLNLVIMPIKDGRLARIVNYQVSTFTPRVVLLITTT